ncbi:hypothetical protein [Kitasatospora acidiphila]|uniref:hypothetical protein n=1 Tax=Kitasatospora acidiphila TaxID=2567942 RepID=UPI002B3FFF1E|nr:hypothetical protein [Kitasatospora acidiphila]
MTNEFKDGSAGDADYGSIGAGYSNYRQPDPRIAELIQQALGEVRTVVNVGAGRGPTRPGRSSSPRWSRPR